MRGRVIAAATAVLAGARAAVAFATSSEAHPTGIGVAKLVSAQ